MTLSDLQGKAAGGDIRAQVQLAARLDQTGRHDDAINWLATAAKTGDAEALTLLGFRLLSGRDCPHLPAQGASMLVDAARAGGGEAAAFTAMLAGGGFYGPQNWAVALDQLQNAAEAGWPAARAQLRILAGGPAPSASAPAEAARADSWRELRRNVDVAAWTSAPAPRNLSDSPRVLAVEALVSPETCDWVIAQSQGRLERALVNDPETGLTIMGQTRTNQAANFALVDTNLVNLFIQARIAAAAQVPIQMMEAFAVLHYGVGEQASEHFDFLDPLVPAYAAVIAQYGQRVATCLLYLNDDYEGGETDFPELGFSHRGRKGDALIFHSADASGVPDPRTLHAGRPPTSGEKWVLSQFIRNRPRAGL